MQVMREVDGPCAFVGGSQVIVAAETGGGEVTRVADQVWVGHAHGLPHAIHQPRQTSPPLLVGLP